MLANSHLRFRPQFAYNPCSYLSIDNDTYACDGRNRLTASMSDAYTRPRRDVLNMNKFLYHSCSLVV